jgi:hypothetical protein
VINDILYNTFSMHIYTRTLTAWLSRRPHQRYMLTANIKFALRPFDPGFDPARGSNIWPYKRRYFVSRTESIGRNQSIERQNVNNDDPRRYNAIRRRPSKLTFSRHIRIIIVSLSDNQLAMRNPFRNLFTCFSYYVNKEVPLKRKIFLAIPAGTLIEMVICFY